jgi:hypothetical protein
MISSLFSLHLVEFYLGLGLGLALLRHGTI